MFNKHIICKIVCKNESQLEISINSNLILELSRDIRDAASPVTCRLCELVLSPLSGSLSLSVSLTGATQLIFGLNACAGTGGGIRQQQ